MALSELIKGLVSQLGGKMPKFKGVGLFKSDLANRHSDPYDDIAVNKDSNPDTLDEVCSSCHRTGTFSLVSLKVCSNS